MADNLAVTPGTGATIAADDVGSALHQYVKVEFGANNTATPVDSTNPLPVTLANTGANATAVKTDPSAVTSPVSVAAAATSIAKAEDAAHVTGDVGVPAFAVRESTPTDLSAGNTNGDYEPLQVDANGALWSSQATLLAGEDLTNNVLKTEQRFSYSAVAVADTQVKSSAGFLHSVTISCNDAAPTAGSLIIYDNTAESGTVVFNHTFTTTPFPPFTVILDCIMGTGIYVGMTTTADVNFSCSYR